MSENSENPTTDNQGVKSDSVQADVNASVDTDNVNKPVENIPYARFSEVSKQKKELETKLREIEAKQEQSRIKAMEEQGKYKELNKELSEKLNSYEEKLNVYAEKEAKEREDLISQLDDKDKDLYGALNNDQLRKHLSKVQKSQSVATNTTQAVRDVSNTKVNDWTSLSSEDKRSNWKDIIKTYTKK
jgi:dsDNA-specific endonuclease/ATPase MutS2